MHRGSVLFVAIQVLIGCLSQGTAIAQLGIPCVEELPGLTDNFYYEHVTSSGFTMVFEGAKAIPTMAYLPGDPDWGNVELHRIRRVDTLGFTFACDCGGNTNCEEECFEYLKVDIESDFFVEHSFRWVDLNGNPRVDVVQLTSEHINAYYDRKYAATLASATLI